MTLSSTTEVRLLTVAEVADRLRLAKSTVYQFIRDGELAAVRLGRAVRIKPEAVDTFLSRAEPKKRYVLLD